MVLVDMFAGSGARAGPRLDGDDGGAVARFPGPEVAVDHRQHAREGEAVERPVGPAALVAEGEDDAVVAYRHHPEGIGAEGRVTDRPDRRIDLVVGGAAGQRERQEGKCEEALHPALDGGVAPCESTAVVDCLMWRTQIRVKRRRAVSKSTSTLPCRHSVRSSAPSLWRPRLAMSIASI